MGGAASSIRQYSNPNSMIKRIQCLKKRKQIREKLANSHQKHRLATKSTQPPPHPQNPPSSPSAHPLCTTTPPQQSPQTSLLWVPTKSSSPPKTQLQTSSSLLNSSHLKAAAPSSRRWDHDRPPLHCQKV